MTLTIYGIARSRAIRTLWMANELGIDYQHKQIGFGPEGAGSPAFLMVNPNGLVSLLTNRGIRVP